MSVVFMPHAQLSGVARTHVALHSSRMRISQRCRFAGALAVWASQSPAIGLAKAIYLAMRSWLGVPLAADVHAEVAVFVRLEDFEEAGGERVVAARRQHCAFAEA